MKIFRKKKRYGCAGAQFPALALLVLMAGGCSVSEVTDPRLTEEAEELHLRLSIETDGYTRAGLTPDFDVSAAERRIDNVLVMLFGENADGSLGSLILSRTAEVDSEDPEQGAIRRFDVKVALSGKTEIPDRMRVVTLANGADRADAVAAMVGKAYSVIRADEALWRPEESDGEGAPLFTMWGCAKDPVTKSERTQNVGMTMLRDKAKVSVTLAKDTEGKSRVTGDSEFTLAHALVYNRRPEISIFPDLEALGSPFGSGTGLDPYAVNTPSVKKDAAGNTLQTGLAADEGYADAVSPTGLSSVSLYVPEQDVLMGRDASVDDANAMKRPALIVGGYTGGDTGKLTWYRVDFADDTDADDKPVLTDILRNHHYRVNVTAVNGPGEETPEEAYLTLQTKVEATVVDWTDMEWDAEFDGANWIAAQREVTVGVSAGDFAELILRSNIPSDSWTFSWNEEGEGLFSAEIADEDSDTPESSDHPTKVIVKALQDLPDSTESRTAVLTVTVSAKLRFVINVIQKKAETSGDTDDGHDPWKDDDLYWIFQ